MTSPVHALFTPRPTARMSALGRSALGRVAVVIPALIALWAAVAWAVSLP